MHALTLAWSRRARTRAARCYPFTPYRSSQFEWFVGPSSVLAQTLATNLGTESETARCVSRAATAAGGV
jgi:hypothetical protein